MACQSCEERRQALLKAAKGIVNAFDDAITGQRFVNREMRDLRIAVDRNEDDEVHEND